MEGMDGGLARLASPARRLLHYFNRNTKAGSQRNIAAHYDLGNEFFELILDPTLMYSCAIFLRPDSTLEEAAIAKVDRICRKLDLRAHDHLLEIGTGWGGFAIHAARNYGCRVTTTTISRAQHDYAVKKIAEQGLQDRITVLFKDYRDLSGQFDKAVSIEMIEAVGHQFVDSYFRKCGELLKPDGVMLLQAITIADQFYESAVRNVDFIKKYIFPGSFIPSVTSLCNSITRASDMRLFHLEDLTPNYAETLKSWRLRMFQNIERALKPGGTALIVVPSLDSALFSSLRLIDWYKTEGVSLEDIPASDIDYFKNNKREFIQGIVYIDKVPTKHYTAPELEMIFQQTHLDITALEKLEYEWDTEFTSPPSWMKAPYPWDWLVELKKR